jgi:hypothetical protein
MTAPTQESLEAQRIAALAACLAAKTALQCGQHGTAKTKLQIVEVYLQALAKEAGNVRA